MPLKWVTVYCFCMLQCYMFRSSSVSTCKMLYLHLLYYACDEIVWKTAINALIVMLASPAPRSNFMNLSGRYKGVGSHIQSAAALSTVNICAAICGQIKCTWDWRTQTLIIGEVFWLCKIRGLHGSDYEECSLLSCGAVWVLLEPTCRFLLHSRKSRRARNNVSSNLQSVNYGERS
jgi:hypothetical protein